MAGFISLPHNWIDNFIESFYKDWLEGIDFSQDTDFQQLLVNNAPSEDVKKYLLATNEFGKEVQGKIDLYVTNNILNKASFRSKLDPTSKI